MGLLKTPSSGKIYINGMDISSIKYQSSLRRKVGVIEKHIMLLENYNIETNIMLPEAFGGYHPKYEKLRIIATKWGGVTDKLKAYPNELSKREQIFVLFARFEYCKFHTVIADIDILDEEELFTLLQLCKLNNITLVYITKYSEFMQLSYAYILIEDGKVEKYERIFSNKK